MILNLWSGQSPVIQTIYSMSASLLIERIPAVVNDRLNRATDFRRNETIKKTEKGSSDPL
jgi:hypothetical protein